MSSTLPAIQPHTQAKHHILRYHLQAWFPILGRRNGKLMYVDGFCGPGEYKGGDPGSPLVALRAIRDHSFFPDFEAGRGTVKYLFVDKDLDFIQHLTEKVQAASWTKACSIEIKRAEFSDVMQALLDDIDASDQSMPPALIFIDPFGSAGFPMTLMKRLAAHARVEVLINLNHREFVRWIIPDPQKHVTADSLYGGERWRPALKLSGREQSQFLVTEYEKALEEIGWRCTSFEMVDSQNQTAYHLVFGTGNHKGLEVMKTAMRAASQTGEFRYTDRIDPSQPVFLGLDKEKEYPIEVGECLFQKYNGREIHYDRLLKDDINWHRWWLPKDLRGGLESLEYGDDPRILKVRRMDGNKRKAKSYTNCFITFGRPDRQPRLL